MEKMEAGLKGLCVTVCEK